MKKSEKIYQVAISFLGFQYGETPSKEEELTNEQLMECCAWLMEELRTAKAVEDWEAEEAKKKEAEENG